MRVTKAFSSKDYCPNQKIIIYGAGNYGRIAFEALKMLNIDPDYFMDRNHVGELYNGVPIIAPSDISEHKDAIFLIAVLNGFSEVVQFMMDNDIKDLYDIEELIRLCPEKNIDEYSLDEKNNIEKYLTVINNFYSEEELVVGHVEVVVTERCTLKCRDCANLMQYYEKPMNLDVSDICRTFDRFLQVVDSLLELRILGGEPFLVTNLDVLIKHYIEERKVKKITVYTNSTIIPNQRIIQSLKNPKISVHISDYGINREKVDRLQEELKKENVNFYIHVYNEWNDLGDLRKRNYTTEEMENLFSDCLMSKCNTFYRGKLYLCPRSAHGEQLGVFQNKEFELIDFEDEKIDLIEYRKKVKSLLKNTKSITACNYCNGSCIRSTKIMAAKQMDRRKG